MVQNIKTGNHTWEKQNSVTQIGRKGTYDILKCKCGLKAKRINLEQVNIDARKKSKAAKCSLYEPKEETGKVIIITRCSAGGKAFENLTPNSEHILITPPEGRDIDETWVQGVGEPVRLLDYEFKYK